ncbi:19633_t:CDS:2 [Gigaspora margarita]|uniref:19633_t:CDS:1 n=1 Tax=Gigaspora margarita TaxID=4874 RepID=A0ABN7UF59_GIGMA|nr:19633_t:CDS:2 [Gigaspora margarita]
MPTWQDIEKSIINILRAGIFYNKDKTTGFMDYYKKQLDELHKSKDQEQYIITKARALLPNEEIYDAKIKAFSNSYYKKEQREKELQAWLNS